MAGEETRNMDLDIVKGMLVLVMVTYHCASVAEGSGVLPQAESITFRFSFLRHAFIMISGYLCGWHYLPRMAGEGVRKRLAVRAAKLLAILFFSNVVLYWAGVGYNFNGLSVIDSLADIVDNFVLDINPDLVAFEVLYYIAVFLLAASIVIGRLRIMPLAAIVLVSLILLPKMWLFRSIEIGMIGMLGGMMVIGGQLSHVWRWIERTRGFPVIAALITYEIFLPDIRALLKAHIGLVTAGYTLETTLWFISSVFVFRATGAIKKGIVLIGNYTLLGYMMQMLIIRVGFSILASAGVGGYTYYFANWVGSAIVLYLFIRSLHHLRKSSAFVDGAYRAVFA